MRRGQNKDYKQRKTGKKEKIQERQMAKTKVQRRGRNVKKVTIRRGGGFQTLTEALPDGDGVEVKVFDEAVLVKEEDTEHGDWPTSAHAVQGKGVEAPHAHTGQQVLPREEK